MLVNAPDSIVVSLSVIIKDSSALSLWNISFPIVLPRITAFSKLEQLWNTPVPYVVTVDGTTMLVIEDLRKANCPMLTSPSGKITLVIGIVLPLVA